MPSSGWKARIIESESEVSMFRLFRMLNEEQPDILAVDSLQEIAVDQHELFFFLQSLPPQTRLVQVTGGERKETLGKVAARLQYQFQPVRSVRRGPHHRTGGLIGSRGRGYCI